MRCSISCKYLPWKGMRVYWGSLVKTSVLSLILLGLMGFLGASPVADSLRAELKKAYRDDLMLGVINAWLPKMVDEQDFRLIQGYWGRVDREGMDKWFEDKHLADPDDPLFHYLWLRTLCDMDEKLDGVETTITAHPDYYWAYRLLANEFSNCISISRSCFGGHYARERLDAKETIYRDMLLQGERIFGPDPVILSALGDYYLFNGDHDLTESIALKLAQSTEPFRANGFIYRLCDYLESAEPAKRVLPFLVARNIELGTYPPQDSLKRYNDGMMKAHYWAGQWTALDSLLTANPELKSNRDYRWVILPMLLNLGRVPEAIEVAREYVLQGYSLDTLIDYIRLDDDFEDDRWYEFEDMIPLYEEQARQKEKEQFEQNRLGRELPPLEIRDEAGNLIQLSDWLGKDLTVCFWVSWDEGGHHVFSLAPGESRPEQLIYVNGYDSTPERAKKLLSELAPDIPYYSIDDASLQRLGIGYLPTTIIIGPDGKLDYVYDEIEMFQGLREYSYD